MTEHLLLMRRLPHAERRPGHEWPRLLGMALLGMVGCPVTLYLALRYTTAGSSAMITGTEPLVTALLAGCLLGTRLTPGQLGGAALSMLGVVFVTPALRFGASAGVGGGTNGALNGLTLKRGDLIILANVIM
jgi:drug/metabolite transporter (DMT)-like permease